MKKLSIIIPIYNVEEYIEKCLRSALDISIDPKDYEILLINDGTPDNSMDKVADYVSRYDHIKVYEQPNKGLGGARNTGLKMATGEYVYFLDSDDYLDSEAFTSFFEEGYAQNTDVVIGNYQLVIDKQVRKVPYKFKEEITDRLTEKGTDFFVNHYGSSIGSSVWTNIYKRSFLIDNQLFFFEKVQFEDANWTPKVLLAAHKVSYIPIVFYNYLIRSGSITHSSYSLKKLNDILCAADDLLKYSQNIEKRVQKKVGYWAVHMIMTSIGRYENIATLTNSEQSQINNILNRECAHYFRIRVVLFLYFIFYRQFNCLMKYWMRNKE